MTRYALVKGARSLAEVEAYLPENYRVVYEYISADGHDTEGRPYKSYDPDSSVPGTPGFVIEGEDRAGWTLEAYVIPRCASGLIWVTEIDKAHPILLFIPSKVAAAAQQRWYVHCGCDHHGDHLGCDPSCESCQHPCGVEITAATEQEADSHVHDPACGSRRTQ